MDGDGGCLLKEVVFDAGDGEVVSEILFHILFCDPFQMASGDDS